jgi:hypothetical protein
MSNFIAILLILLAIWGVSNLVGFYNKTKVATDGPPRSQSATPAPDPLPALPPALEASLAQARAGGVEGLRDWLTTNQATVRDPRRAAIELDYAQLLVRSDPAGARRVFQGVRSRVTADSPVYDRVQKLAKLFD